VRPHIWHLICPACEASGDAFVERCRFDSAGVLTHVREVPAMTGAHDDGPEITVHTGGRAPMAAVLGQVATSFYNLAKARRSWALHPPVKWVLELRDGGRVWAPSDPCRDPRWWRGEALPLRQTTLRDRRRKRGPWSGDCGHGTDCECQPCRDQRIIGEPARLDGRACASCSAALGAGMTAWRADPVGHVNRHGESTHGWHSDGLRTLWCPSCVAAVTTIVECNGAGVVVRHMRVIEGGAG
jgi:hypothetical protein